MSSLFSQLWKVAVTLSLLFIVVVFLSYIPPQELVDASSSPLQKWASSGITLPSGTVVSVDK